MPEETVRTLSVYGLRYGYRLLQQPAPRTEPVVILGGALQGMFGWPQMDNHVGAVADVVTADLPGMGGADALPAVPSAGIMRSALTRIIDDLGVEKVNLFGYSYGTSIALAVRSAQPGPHRPADPRRRAVPHRRQPTRPLATGRGPAEGR